MNAFRRTAALSVVSLVISALAHSACGSSDSTTSTAAATSGGETVMTASVSGVGTALVDADSDALYSPSQEANGAIRCTGSCAQIGSH